MTFPSQQDDITAVEYVQVLQPMRARSTVRNRRLEAIYECVYLPGQQNLGLPPNSRVILREKVLPDWRRIELKAGLGPPAISGSLERWNVEVLRRVLLEVATATVALGYYPIDRQKAPDLVWPVEPSHSGGYMPIKDIRLVIKRRVRTRTGRFQLQHGGEVQNAMRGICFSYGLPPQLHGWLTQVFYSGPGDGMSRHSLARAGHISAGPFFSIALRLNPERWGFTVYQPGNWITSLSADHLIPKPSEFVVRGNIKLFASLGFEALGTWLNQLRYAEALVPVRHVRTGTPLNMPSRDGKWAIRLGDGLKQEPPDWVREVGEGRLASEGDFLIGADLAYFGSSQFRIMGAKLRSLWEKEKDGGEYVITAHRPRRAMMPDVRILRHLARVALGIEPRDSTNKDKARDLTREYLRGFRRNYRRAHGIEPEPQELEIQRVLARWAWMP